MKPIEIGNEKLGLYLKSMGKLFRVLAVVGTIDEANRICERNDNAAVITEDKSGNIYIADKYAAICKSELISERKNYEP